MLDILKNISDIKAIYQAGVGITDLKLTLRW